MRIEERVRDQGQHDGRKPSPLLIPNRCPPPSQNEPDDYGKRGENKQRMTESPVIGEVCNRIAVIDEHIEVWQRSECCAQYQCFSSMSGGGANACHAGAEGSLGN